MKKTYEIAEKSIPEFSYAAWMTDEDTFWACGFNFGANNNQFDRFIENNIWEGRFNKDKDKKQIARAQKVRPGNVLILKTSYTKGEKHSTPATKIYAVGVVRAISEPKDIGQNYLSYVFNVNYRKIDPPHEFVNFSPYRDTISLVKNDELKTFAKNILGDNRMAIEESGLTKKYVSLLKANHNLILHGAPGTGKTYLAKEIAKGMGCTDNEINFVQFHPSYDYTDFVEGLRPKNSDDGNSIGFERKNGVFKEFCERAIKATKNPETIDNFEESWKKLVDKLDEVGVLDISLLSGRGTFPIELNEYGTGLASRTYKTEKRDAWISGKSKFFNKEQLNNIYRGLPGVPAEGYDNYRKAVVKYMKENFGLRDLPSIPNIGAQQLKANVQKQPFIFIIDEINRGEISKIFGELFFSIDPGYRGFDKNGKPKGLVKTQYQNLVEGGEFVNGFYVPENVYIIGTMNDIDRSVESMDFAMRRRFIFKEITSADSATNMKLSEEAMSKMENLNDAISAIEGLNSSYHIGGAYFLKETEIDGVSEKVSVDSSGFADLWELKLEPLLKEYLRGMEDASEKLKSLKDAYDKE